MSTGFAEGLSNAADEVALQILGKVPQLLPCAGTGGTACAQQFVDKYATKAFRRPLQAAERTALLSQFDAAIGEHGNFAAAIAELAATILQHPLFVYLPEIGKLEGGLRCSMTTRSARASRFCSGTRRPTTNYCARQKLAS